MIREPDALAGCLAVSRVAGMWPHKQKRGSQPLAPGPLYMHAQKSEPAVAGWSLRTNNNKRKQEGSEALEKKGAIRPAFEVDRAALVLAGPCPPAACREG